MPASARDIFSDQFEPIDGDYLYRRRHKDAPIRITRAELDLFMDRFDRRNGKMAGVGAVAGIVMLAPVAAISLLVPEEFQTWGILAICAAFAGCVFLASNWLWDEPARMLKGRAPCGPAFSRHHAMRLTYARTSYARMALGLAMLALVPALLPAAREPAWLAASAGGGIFVLFHILQKWRAEHAGD